MRDRPVKFLIVDDLEGNLVAMEALLQREGLQLLKARSGAQALECLLVHDVALAFVDVQMPEMDGFELAELMRGAERTRRVPIIFVTAGAATTERRFRGYELGAVDFLFKPIDPHILRSKAEVFFELAKQRDEIKQIAEENARLLEQREAAERQARASEEVYRQQFFELEGIYQAAPLGLCVFDRDLRYLRLNERLAELNGIPPQEHIGKTVREVVPSLADQAEAVLRRILETGKPVHLEFRGETPAQPGVQRIWDEHWYPLRGADHAITGVGVIAEEVTERRQAEAALRQAQADLQRHAVILEKTVEKRTAKLREAVAELEAFSYSIAHDLRAPLRSLRGFSDLLVEGYAERLDEKARSYVERISSSAARMDKLIVDVLSYSKVLRGEARMTSVDVSALVTDILSCYPGLAEKSGEIQVDPGIPPVVANEAMLTQVLSNLLGNAVKFVREDASPVVRVSAVKRDGRVRIFVRDNGIGIPDDQHEKIFDMFQRVHKTFEGTGMGLAIVRKAMQRMGGSAGVESSSGQGSTFWIDLPAST